MLKLSAIFVFMLFQLNGFSQIRDSLEHSTLLDTVVNDTNLIVLLDTIESDSIINVSENDYDKIITNDGNILIGKVNRINATEVYVKFPLNTVSLPLYRETISQIIYNDGSIEVLNYLDESVEYKLTGAVKERVVVRNQDDWEKVQLIESENDSLQIVEIDKIKVQYQSPKMRADSEFLEKNAIIILKKKAANTGAHLVKIVNKDIVRAYGDLPYIEINAIAYGYPEQQDLGEK